MAVKASATSITTEVRADISSSHQHCHQNPLYFYRQHHGCVRPQQEGPSIGYLMFDWTMELLQKRVEVLMYSCTCQKVDQNNMLRAIIVGGPAIIRGACQHSRRQMKKGQTDSDDCIIFLNVVTQGAYHCAHGRNHSDFCQRIWTTYTFVSCAGQGD